MKKYNAVRKLTHNRFLNLYEMEALTNTGKAFSYYFASRNEEDKLDLRTKGGISDGVAVYALLGEAPDKIVLIRQYRYPLDDYLYELPAGLLEENETAEETAVREMKEETGLELKVYTEGNQSFRRSFYLGAGFTDECNQTVFGYVSGDITNRYLEDSERIQVILADKEEAARILREEKVSMRCAYLLMNFLQSKKEEPFAFLGAE